jgi:GNAT superfamily N-acetyltransferase
MRRWRVSARCWRDEPMRRQLSDGFELDDDLERIDVAAVHAFISGQSYWGRERSLELVQRSIQGSSRVVGLYLDGAQVGFARAVSDGVILAYLADVYVLEEHRGRGLGLELLHEILNGDWGPDVRWMLHTADAGELYLKLGFDELRRPRLKLGRVIYAPRRYPVFERGPGYDSRA